MDSTRQEVSTAKNIKPKDETPRKFRLTFRAKGHRKRVLYATTTEDKIEGEKEHWAMFLEEQTGIAWHCDLVEDMEDRYTSTMGKDVGDG